MDTGMGPNLPGSLLDELNARGIERDEITVVVNTHLHPDHVGWNVTWRRSSRARRFRGPATGCRRPTGSISANLSGWSNTPISAGQ